MAGWRSGEVRVRRAWRSNTSRTNPTSPGRRVSTIRLPNRRRRGARTLAGSRRKRGSSPKGRGARVLPRPSGNTGTPSSWPRRGGCRSPALHLQDFTAYSGTSKVILHIARGGAELPHLRKLAGDPLDAPFDLCHVAVGSLGTHRELKGVKYCAQMLYA